MRKFWVVFSQVFFKNLKSGSWIFLVLSPLIVLLIGGGIFYYVAQTTEPAKVAVVSEQPLAPLLAQQDKETKYKTYSVQAAQKALADEKVDGVLTVSLTPTFKASYKNRENSQTVSDTTLTQSLSRLKTQQAAAALKLTPTQLSALLTPAKVTTKTVAFVDGKQVAKSNSAGDINRGFAFAVTFLMIMVTMTYGSMLASEIATEKGSRIMEILLSSVSATTQFFGKIAGVFALLLVQIAVYAVTGAIAWQWAKNQSFIQQYLHGVDLSFLWNAPGLITVAFFLVGTLLYAVLAAMAGSLVSNLEQVQQAVMPISLFGMLGYFGALIAQQNDAIVVKVASYVPFISASVMPVRLTLGRAGAAEALVSLAVSIVFLIAFTWLSVAIYRSNVLVYSDAGVLKSMRKSWQIWRSEQGK
ncbi:ABC transporter permease [Lacticaseibacillus saniviri]